MARAKTKVSARRSYRQFCGLARALDVLGERWTLLIVRNLLLGPRRYSDLLEELPGITTNLLAQRLKDLEAERLIERVELGRPSPAVLYALTSTGETLEPALLELAKWGGRYLDRPHRDDRLDLGWALLSMKRRYRGGVTLRVHLAVVERHFAIELAPDAVVVKERVPESPDLVVRGDLSAMLDLLFLHRDPNELLASGRIGLEGSRAAFRRFLAAFPPSASPASLGRHENAR